MAKKRSKVSEVLTVSELDSVAKMVDTWQKRKGQVYTEWASKLNVNTQQENNITDMSMATMTLEDIPTLPDLSGFVEAGPAPFENGWYKGVIQETRTFTDKNGNDRVFQSTDEPAQRSGRNIRLQVELTRADGRKLNISWLNNYNPAHLTAESVQAVMARKSESTDGQYGDLFPAFMTIQKLGKLQKVSGVRQLQQVPDGGLDLSALFGKEAYFKLADDDRDNKYKTIKDVRVITERPTKVL